MDEERTVAGNHFREPGVCENHRVHRSLLARPWTFAPVIAAAALVAAGCSSGTSQAPPGTTPTEASQTSQPTQASQPAQASQTSQPTTAVPRVAHVVVVMMENHSFGDVLGGPDAPYLTSLAARGADFTRSFAVSHPSEPNYLAIFSGSTQGVTSDACPQTFDAPNLATDLLNAGKTFAGYAEGLPATGSPVCSAGEYARKHVPWVDFSTVPPAVSKPFSSWPDGDYTSLPTVSFVIPNLCDDMHDCPVPTGDAWLRAHLDGYASWAMTHDSLLIVTWDEDDGGGQNQIPTIFVGQPVRPGHYATQINHYSVLRTIEDAFGLRHDGAAATASPVTGIWATG
jgi:phospholipase C